jgi:hypothetical protein
MKKEFGERLAKSRELRAMDRQYFPLHFPLSPTQVKR